MLDCLADGLFVATAPQTFLGMHVGTRMTVVRLASGDVWVHSPVHFTPELGAAVDAIGPVTHIVAPNLYHHLYAGEWTRAYTRAALHAPAALQQKRDDLRVTSTLEKAAQESWAGELTPIHIDGCKLDETVFLHRATRTVVASDLAENFETSDHWPTRMYLKAAGLHGNIGWSRLFRFVYGDKAAARRSVTALLDHDFDRVIVAHGAVIASGAKDAVRHTFEFLG